MDLEDRLTAALSDRYSIEAEIDTGGMASVYRARDLKHDRTVAIKVLRPDLAEAIGADRFLREIRTTANLSHPHILPLHDSGEADGFLYYVMPFVEGESLADRLTREGQLPVEDAVQIAREVADALAYAHDKGVIHRDIKPANILLERGHALLADFGIAQAKAGAEETKLTGSGMSLGTPSYMSPEQIAGNREVDGRSDQYALASVLYEMLAGHAPFTGADIQAVMRQHLAADAPSMTQARPTVSRGLAKAVHRALAKSPADRFRTMNEFEKALAGATLPLLARIPMGRARAAIFAVPVLLGLGVVAVIASVWNPGEPELQDSRILVLPFENETGDPDYDFLERRLATSIIEGISMAGVGMPVPYAAAKASWMAVTDTELVAPGRDPTLLVAEEYRAGTVVSGYLFPQGDSLGIEVEVRSRGGTERVFALDPVVVSFDDHGAMVAVTEVTERVAAAVGHYLDPGWERPTSLLQTRPPRSGAVLQAMDASIEAFEDRDWDRSRSEAQRAVDLDPSYLPAKALLAHALFTLADLSGADSLLSEADSLLDELEAFRTQLAPGDRYALDGARAILAGGLWARYETAKESFQRFPSSTGALEVAIAAHRVNRPGEAYETLSRFDPDSPSLVKTGTWRRFGSELCSALHMLGDHTRELREVRKLRSLYPEWFIPAEIRARAALGQGEEVRELLEEAVRKNGDAHSAFAAAILEFRAHDHTDAWRAFAERYLVYVQDESGGSANTPADRYRLLNALYFLERWDEAYAIAEALIQGDPTQLSHLALKGILAARLGRKEEAKRTSERIAALEIPYDRGETTFIRACIASLLGERDHAFRLLEEAHRQGWGFDVTLHTDMDLEPLRGYPPFEDFLRPKG